MTFVAVCEIPTARVQRPKHAAFKISTSGMALMMLGIVCVCLRMNPRVDIVGWGPSKGGTRGGLGEGGGSPGNYYKSCMRVEWSMVWYGMVWYGMV